jgi:hypothetical protein
VSLQCIQGLEENSQKGEVTVLSGTRGLSIKGEFTVYPGSRRELPDRGAYSSFRDLRIFLKGVFTFCNTVYPVIKPEICLVGYFHAQSRGLKVY